MFLCFKIVTIDDYTYLFVNCNYLESTISMESISSAYHEPMLLKYLTLDVCVFLVPECCVNLPIAMCQDSLNKRQHLYLLVKKSIEIFYFE